MKSMTLKLKINLVATVVFMVTLTVLIISSYTGSKRIMTDEIQQEFTSHASDLGYFIDSWIQAKSHEMDLAAAIVAENLNDEEKMVHDLDRVAKSGKHDLLYLGTEADGRFIPSDPSQKVPADYDPRVRPWYTMAKGKNKVVVTEPYVDVSTGNLVVSFAKEVVVNGKLIGVVADDINLEALKEAILNQSFGTTGYAFMTDINSKIYVHPDKELVNKNYAELSDSLSAVGSLFKENQSGSLEFNLNNQDKIMFFHKLKEADWVVSVAFDKSEVYAPLQTLLSRMVITAFVFLAVGIAILIFSIRKMLNPLNVFIERLRDIAEGEGDLTKKIAEDRKDELGTVAKLFNKFVGDIRTVLAEVQESSESVAASSTQLAANVKSITDGLNAQGNETNELAAAVEEMNTTIAQIAENATDTAHQADKTMDKAKSGQDAVDETVNTMRNIASKVKESALVMSQLGASTEEIGNIINVINDIADQTNLLALNAAIEAARAGEHGRGFAVVADEVRKLAERTQNATSEITSMIGNLQKESSKAVSNIESGVDEVEKGTAVADQAGLRLREIIEFNTITTDMITQIAAAAEEQSTTTNEIASSVSEINSVTEENTIQVSIINEASQHLSEIAESLKAKVSVFRV